MHYLIKVSADDLVALNTEVTNIIDFVAASDSDVDTETYGPFREDSNRRIHQDGTPCQGTPTCAWSNDGLSHHRDWPQW